MAASRLLRNVHRWTSALFTLTVILNFAVRASGEPPDWITYSPLLPLAVLMLTGTYLFIRSYTEKFSAT
ncbi:MAG: hypothetical protein V4628_17325 [Pseudomonadota bacterium]